MNPRALVVPLEPRWQEILDEALVPHRVATGDVARLAPRLAELSRAYNAAEAEGRRTRLPLDARIAFSFPRDVPKGAGAVRELVGAGTLALAPDRPLRVLDLGAGLGAMSWGIARALAAGGGAGRVEATLVDEDAEALERARTIASAARARLGDAPVALDVTTRVQGVGAAGELRALASRPYDVVVFGQVLSELDPRAEPAARVEGQAALLEEALATLLAPDGALVVVEPALRERTRHLHAVRDRLLERGSASVFAPCLHRARCPMLSVETEWCHEDLDVDLPAWVAPLARAAGLRWQGLTFSFLVLRRDGRTRLDAPPGRGVLRLRAVSDLLRSKGKAELFICDEHGVRSRIRRLDRDAAAGAGVPFDELRRGDLVTLTAPERDRPEGAERADDGPVDDRGRLRPGAHVAIDVAAARK